VVADSDSQIHTYRVARFRHAQVTDERFQRPDPFDLAAYWTESTAAYEREADRVEVTLRVGPAAMHALADLVGRQALGEAERLMPLEDDPDGWQTLRLRIEWPAEVPARLLGLGADAELLEPVEMRQQIEQIARRALDRYAPPAGANLAGHGPATARRGPSLDLPA
jgi:predicted DNA-binding transcriptional regulator YafY